MTEHSIIKVGVADSHAVVRAGLRHILGATQDLVLAAEAETGQEAIKLARGNSVRVLVLEIALPDRNGIEVLKQIRKEAPELGVLVLSMHREDQYAIRALKAGASGFLAKSGAPELLLAAIRQIAAGQRYVSPALAQELARQIGDDSDAPPHQALSDREYQTLTMIASGKTVSSIARELSLSVKTISEYRSRLLMKMKLRNSAELTLYAIKNQLVE